MKLTIDKLYGEITVLMTYCATGDVEYLSSTECANRFKNILETIKEYKIIEKELGIDLITLFKALKDGIYVNGEKVDVLLFYDMDFFNKTSFQLHASNGINYYIKDYGKTWALTKEELL